MTHFITITDPNQKKVRINLAHIIYYMKYSIDFANVDGTRIVLTGHNDEIQLALEQPEQIDQLIQTASAGRGKK